MTTVTVLAGLFVVIVALAYIRLVRAVSHSGGVPRIGGSGVFGYIKTALKWTTDAEAIIHQGQAKFLGRPFVIPTLAGPVFLLGPEYLDRLRSATDEVFNEPMAVNSDLQLPYTMDEHQLSNPYQASVLRTDVNRAIPSYIPEILEESILAMEADFKISDKGFADIAVFKTMTHLIARISNRVIFGTELCRNEAFLKAIVTFSETLPIIGTLIHWMPSSFRRMGYLVLSFILGGKQDPLKFILPFLKQYMKDREMMDEKPNLVCEFLIRNAPPHETVMGLAMRLMNLNFGSIHTSSIFITQTLLELATLPVEDIDSIREEIKEGLESEGGWTKGALFKFRKIDSALREIGRFYGLMFFALGRFALVDCDLGDGTKVPAGFLTAINMRAIHFNTDVYVLPERCDLFRFSKMREAEGTDAKYGFATVDSHYLPFGAGRHACAGRFFAAMELKIMLAHILMNYDISFPPGVNKRPDNLILNGAIIPNPKARLIFTPRQTKYAQF